jgi:hypothetical protein
MIRTPLHETGNSTTTGSPGPTGRTLTAGDLTAIGAAVGTAFTAAVRESRTPAPPPRTPDDNDGDTGDAYRDRADVLLGSFARVAPTYYSVDQLAKNPDAMGALFDPRRYV